MGCTSSAPNTLSANASKEEKSMEIEEDSEDTYMRQIESIDTDHENRTEINVLPASDTTESAELVRNNKSTTSLEPEKDLNTNGHTVKSESSDTTETTNQSKNIDLDNKISKLKLEIVDKFFEMTQQEKVPDTFLDNLNTETTELEDNENEENKVVPVPEVNGENETNSEEAAEASPSQSQSSRATRWEALADIAAELPPSLAVDPLTGQIYSLSK